MNFSILTIIGLSIATIKAFKFFSPNNDRYCNSPYCSIGVPTLEHVNCNNPHEIQCLSQTPATPTGPYSGKLHILTKEDKDTILEYHNQFRNNIACGKADPLPPATRMNLLTWDKQLAEAAELNVIECDYGHDCHNTETYPYSGQNIGLKYTITNYTNAMDYAMQTIQEWYDEMNNANETIVQKYVKGTDENAEYGHFTEMMTDRNTKIGCAVLEYKNNEYGFVWTNVYTVCNYDSTNIIGWQVYDSGPVGTQCPNGKDKTQKCLCKV